MRLIDDIISIYANDDKVVEAGLSLANIKGTSVLEECAYLYQLEDKFHSVLKVLDGYNSEDFVYCLKGDILIYRTERNITQKVLEIIDNKFYGLNTYSDEPTIDLFVLVILMEEHFALKTEDDPTTDNFTNYLNDVYLDSVVILHFLKFLKIRYGNIGEEIAKFYNCLTLINSEEDLAKNMDVYEDFYYKYGMAYELYKKYYLAQIGR